MTLLSSATPKPGGEQRRVEQVGPGLRDAGDERDQRRPDHRDRQALAAVEEAPGPLREQDVEAPEAGGDRARTRRRSCRARRPPATGAASSTMPGSRERDPDEVEPPAREQRRDGDRPEELDRHRDAERDPVERLVEREVHRAEREAEDRDEPQRPRVVAPAPRAPHGEQDERREPQAQHGRPGGPASSNSVAASAAPNWIEVTPVRTSATGGIGSSAGMPRPAACVVAARRAPSEARSIGSSGTR